MATSGSVFSETLQKITDTKLEELSKRRASFEKAKASTLAAVDAISVEEPVRRVEALSAGVKRCFSIHLDKERAVVKGRTKHHVLEAELANLDRFLGQARHDPSVSIEMVLGSWEKSLRRHLNTQSLKYQYATLYGQLVTEWLEGDRANRSGQAKGKTADEDDVEMGEAFEDLGTAARLKARIEWEKNVFTPAIVDEDALESFLSDLFGANGASKGKGRGGDSSASKKDKVFSGLRGIRSSVESFESKLRTQEKFTIDNLQWTISGLLSSGLLPDEKRDVLQDFKNNNTILSEIADVLNMRLSAVDTWSWGDEVAIGQRRTISGIYNVTMHEDLLQAIFLQYIGVRWSVFFKRAFGDFYGRERDGHWERMSRPVPREDRQRLGYYLGNFTREGSLQFKRQRFYRNNYFVSGLQDYETQLGRDKEGEEEAQYVNAAPKRPHDQGDYQMQLELLEMQNKKRLMMARQDQNSMQQQQLQQQQMAMFSQRPQMAQMAPPGIVPGCGTGPSGRGMGGKGLGRGGAMRHRRVKVEVEDEMDEDSDGSDNETDNGNVAQTPMQLKQRLLHLLSTEITLHTALKGEITVFHSVFNVWNTLLPHETILVVLKFLGVSKTWLGFFAKFLRAPLKFDDDDVSIPARPRQKGTAAAHVLSDVFGEAVLFCLDFAVNQAADGQPVWRIGDDVWFWSADHAVAAKAWSTVQRFAAVTGTSLNTRKTGAVRVGRVNRDTELDNGKLAVEPLPLDASLPEGGEIRWGFLRLNPSSGRFEIDQAMVDSHVAELRRQLRDKKRHSVFGFIQVWNSYASTFFSSNFGKPANCFGRDHVDEMLATHGRIQKEIFSAVAAEFAGDRIVKTEEAVDDDQDFFASTSVVNFLKKTLLRRFGVGDIPDGYLFFPGELGGLDLQSPFISLQQIREATQSSPLKTLAKLVRSEKKCYEQARERFLAGNVQRSLTASGSSSSDLEWAAPADPRERDSFFSFDEFVRHREELAIERMCLNKNGNSISGGDFAVVDVFRTLMKRPAAAAAAGSAAAVDPDADPAVAAALLQLDAHPHRLRGILASWHGMEPYWKWVVMMYGPEIVERFGGMSIVDAGLLPMGMVSIFREKRVAWSG